MNKEYFDSLFADIGGIYVDLQSNKQKIFVYSPIGYENAIDAFVFETWTLSICVLRGDIFSKIFTSPMTSEERAGILQAYGNAIKRHLIIELAAIVEHATKKFCENHSTLPETKLAYSLESWRSIKKRYSLSAEVDKEVVALLQNATNQFANFRSYWRLLPGSIATKHESFCGRLFDLRNSGHDGYIINDAGAALVDFDYCCELLKDTRSFLVDLAEHTE